MYYLGNKSYKEVALDDDLELTDSQKYKAIYYLLEKYLSIKKDKLYVRETA